MRRALSSTAWLALLSFAGCFVPGFDLGSTGGGLPTSTGSTSSTGGAGGAGGTGDQCNGEGLPLAPQNAPSGSQVDQFFALRFVDFGETTLSQRPGFNLDKTCTCCDGCVAESTCTPASDPNPPKSDPRACDAVEGKPNGGIDNAFAVIIRDLAATNSDYGSSGLSDLAATGFWNVLVRVSNYNGEPNDDDVQIAFYTTTGLAPSTGTGGAGGSSSVPLWDGNDDWTVTRDCLADGISLDAPKAIADVAYVSDGVLVGKFDDLDDRVALDVAGALRVELGYGLFSAKLEGTKLEDGVLGGIWTMADAFRSLATLSLDLPVLGSVKICNDPGDSSTYAIYQQVRSSLCAARDSSLSPLAADVGPCDSISLGMSFRAEAIREPSTIVDTPPLEACPPDKSPEFDSCPP
jgi:hypothetical protein